MQLTPIIIQPAARTAVVTALLALLVALGGCVYRMPIQQGNFLEAATIDQLATGMTRSQVNFLLGTPMVPVGFDSSRWEYYYYFKTKRLKRAEVRRVTVYFESDKVARFEKDAAPAAKPAT